MKKEEDKDVENMTFNTKSQDNVSSVGLENNQSRLDQENSTSGRMSLEDQRKDN